MVTQLIATNRISFDLHKSNFSQLGVDKSFTFGIVKFNVKDHPDKDVFLPFPKGSSDYATCLSEPKETLYGYARFFRELFDLTEESEKEILFYIHGYKHPIEKLSSTLRRLQQIYVEDSHCNIDHIVMLSWPSTERLGDYSEDLERAERTGKCAFREFLQEWSTFLRQGFKDCDDSKAFAAKFNLAASSMGNRLLQATAEVYAHDGTQLINELIHTAPDVDFDQFETGKPLQKFSAIARRVHVHFNMGDLILDMSTFFENRLKIRLGKIGPSLGTPRNSKIEYIDVSLSVGIALLNPLLVYRLGNDSGYPAVHSYFLKVKGVATDVKQILSHKTAVTGRIGKRNYQKLDPEVSKGS